MSVAFCGSGNLDRDEAKRMIAEERPYPRRVTVEIESPFGEEQAVWLTEKVARRVGRDALDHAIEAGMLSLTPTGQTRRSDLGALGVVEHYEYRIGVTPEGNKHLTGTRMLNLFPAPSAVMYQFAACEEDFGEINGIVADGNTARVEYSTTTTRPTPFAYAEPVRCGPGTRQHVAIFERYDDGWRLRKPT